MNNLEKVLNEPVVLKPAETEKPKQVEKPTPAANKASALLAQEKALAAASTGSPVFRTAAQYLATSQEIRSCQK
jgi:hypothetical protein